MTHEHPDRLAAAVRALVARTRSAARSTPPHDDAPARDSTARLDALEREVQEMRTRVNALFFAVITAGVGDLVARTVLG